MRMRTPILAIALAFTALLAFGGSPALAQIAPFQMEGSVMTSDTRQPIAGATIDIYRTDVKAAYQTKTNDKGNFTYPVPQQGTYTIIVSAKGYGARYEPNIQPGTRKSKIEFALDPGKGERPTLQDVQAAAAHPAKEDPAAAAEREKAEAEHAKQMELKSQFDERKAHFDTGVQAMQAKQYDSAVTELTAAVQGLEGADPEFFKELASVGGGNLAEVQYRVAVDLYNSGKKDEAKSHLEAGAKAIQLALSFDQTTPVNYQIQGKTLLLLVDKFNEADLADTGAAAYMKASEMEATDPKKKLDLMVKAGDVYRAAYQTDKAIEAYKKVLAVDPNNISALYGIGLAAMGTSESDEAKRKEIYQTAADYLKVFVDKASGDPRAAEAKGVLDTLAKDFKIKPRPIK